MKLKVLGALAVATLTTLSLQASSAQLRECQRQSARLIKRNAALTEQLRNCGRGGNTGELDRLRSENLSLRDRNLSLRNRNQNLRSEVDQLTVTNSSLMSENVAISTENSDLRERNQTLRQRNRRLRRELDNLRGNGRDGQYFCYAGCTDFSGKVDMKLLASGLGVFELEAQNNALSNAQNSYSCNFGVKNVKCEMQGQTERHYCVAACTDFSGRADDRYIAGAQGKSETEARYNALKKAHDENSCTFGVAVSNCTQR